MMITKLTTIASTGRVMNRSVKDFMARAAFGVGWLGIGLEIGSQLVIDHDRHAVAQFKHPSSYDGLSDI